MLQFRQGGPFRRIATSGTYRPRRGDREAGIVRIGNWRTKQKAWEETPVPCPPHTAALVIGTLISRGKQQPRIVDRDTTIFLARALRLGQVEVWRELMPAAADIADAWLQIARQNQSVFAGTGK
jgi:hypothetical protein